MGRPSLLRLGGALTTSQSKFPTKVLSRVSLTPTTYFFGFFFLSEASEATPVLPVYTGYDPHARESILQLDLCLVDYWTLALSFSHRQAHHRVSACDDAALWEFERLATCMSLYI